MNRIWAGPVPSPARREPPCIGFLAGRPVGGAACQTPGPFPVKNDWGGHTLGLLQRAPGAEPPHSHLGLVSD